MQYAERTRTDRREQVVREYRARGYDVVVQPGREQLPEFLAQFQPDVVARGPGENVVIEIKPRSELARSGELERIADAVQHQPGWRLELVVTEEPSPSAGNAPSLGREDLAGILRNVRTLLELDARGDESFGKAAFLYAWSAAEVALRLLAEAEGIQLRRTDAPYLLTQLATEAVLSREEYDFLVHAMHVRNAIAHGFKTDQFQPEEVPALVSTIDRLLRYLPEAA
jgi:hypothetical protein